MENAQFTGLVAKGPTLTSRRRDLFKKRSSHHTLWWLTAIFLIALGLWFTSCGGGSSFDDTPVDNSVSYDAPVTADGTFSVISDEEWDTTAVRKVLMIFAFGGFASDTQIQTWADMVPGEAIVQMLTVDTTNPYLSPADAYDTLDQFDVSLTGLSALWSASSSANKMDSDVRSHYERLSWSSPALTWFAAATKRGLNPVRQKIGLIETNYHLAVNQEVGVSNVQIYSYYDNILNELAAGVPYENVLTNAAISAAVATQYNHKDNLFVDARFEGNEDFAREYHQLFFGILGDYDLDYHELTTIKNTAKALTDMSVEQVTESDKTFLSDTVTFGTEYHYPNSLEILNADIPGNTAQEKITALADLAINHAESLDNLPVIIVRFLADDNLDDDKISQIRAIWQGLETKDLLTFLRKYAISTTFHNETRVKYASSIDRNVTFTNLMTLNNEESYLGYYDPYYYVYNEGVEVFRPAHNVFGAQTGLEASDAGAIFKDAYNRSINNTWLYTRYYNDDDWTKEWGSVIPATNGVYRVEAVANWLWQHFVADGHKNFGTLERAHLYALLGSGKDLGNFIDSASPDTIYTAEDIETDAELSGLYDDMAIATMNLGSSDDDKRGAANYRVGLAIAFIQATPYVFAQEGN